MAKFIGKLSALDKAHFFVALLILLSIIFAIIFSVIEAQWWILFVSLVALFLTLTPTLFEWRYKIDIPEELEIIIIIFVYASLFLGEVTGFYTRFLWWDLVLHAGAGIALGLAGFIILFVLYRGDKVKAKPFTLVVFSFCFALALGAMWEIFEFSMDNLFGLNMQKSGLMDTMWDLIVDAGGALLASVLGYFYLKGRKTHIIDNVVDRFVRNNSELFR